MTRLQRIVAHWRSADRVARAMGVSASAFRKWLKGEAEPSRERLVALAKTTGVSIAWLANGEGPEPNFHDSHVPGTAGERGGVFALGRDRFFIPPVIAEAALAGSPELGPVRETSDQAPQLAFEREWMRATLNVDPDGLVLESASGDSMLPTVGDGDLLLIDTRDCNLREFGIYLLRFEDARLVKRVQRKLDGSLLLISDNPLYESERIPADRASGMEVLGRVVWRGGKL